jgi:CHAT domain-containing protein
MALDSRCRKPQFAIHDEEANVVVVSMPTSPRHTPFASEIEAIVTHTMFWASTVCLEQPTKKRVLYALTSCTVAHFTCHGIVDENNLLQSGLVIEQEADGNLSIADLESVTREYFRIA